MTCDELLGFLHDYVGGDLVVECRETLEVHVKGCERCGVIIQTYRHTVAVARALPKCGPLPPAVEARLRAAIEPELQKVASDPPAHGEAPA
jgi:anti-sigma factor RsiW